MSGHIPGRWNWWTSNSWRRLFSELPGGVQVPVLMPAVHRDGQADIEVRAGDMALIAAAPDLLALAEKYADECSECHGTGTQWTNPHDPQDAMEYSCPACADIRAVIDKAEGRA
jgi:hypothetical protein